jgi:hypothetical protein
MQPGVELALGASWRRSARGAAALPFTGLLKIIAAFKAYSAHRATVHPSNWLMGGPAPTDLSAVSAWHPEILLNLELSGPKVDRRRLWLTKAEALPLRCLIAIESSKALRQRVECL